MNSLFLIEVAAGDGVNNIKPEHVYTQRLGNTGHKLFFLRSNVSFAGRLQ